MEPYEHLEHALASWAGYDPSQMVVCASGTAALHLALECLGLQRGSEILVPDYTMVACARACTLAGLYPVFVDCDDCLLMDLGLAETSLWKRGMGYRAKALMLVHVYGRRCNMERAAAMADRHDLRLIEDLAEAHGVRPHERTDAACWSFYKNKIIAGEEGGAVAFRDPNHASHARSLRNMGFSAAHDFLHAPRGHNYRLSNLHASPILASLARFNDNVRERRRLEAAYNSACPPPWGQPPREAPWVYDVRILGLELQRLGAIVTELVRQGIPARYGFKPMSWQEEYCDWRVIRADREEEGRAEVAARKVFYLPLAGVTETDCLRAFPIIRRVVGQQGR